MYQYSCKVITAKEALYNMHIFSGTDSPKTSPSVNKQMRGRDTHQDLTTRDKQPISESPLSKKPKGSTKKNSTIVTFAKKKASTVTSPKKKESTVVTSPKKKASTVTSPKKKASTVTSPKKKESTVVTSPKEKESTVTSPKKKKKANKPHKKKGKRQPPPPNVQGVDSHSDVPWFLLVNDPVADMCRNMKVIDRDCNQFWVESLEPMSTAAKRIDQIV